jgi:hypothetical protein
MSWDSVWVGVLLFFCVGIGMGLGAWIATRGFEKSLTSAMNDPEAPWNKNE